jgi:adenine phosphoribosyltransferase
MELEHALCLIREIPDYPIPGVLFRDITPLLADGQAFTAITRELAAAKTPYTHCVGIEARGFILAAAIASQQAVGFIPLRKSGKLPFKTIGRSYGLEYGSDEIQAHVDALTQGDRVLLIDDVLATGGTLIAGIELIQELGAQISEIVVLIEIAALDGRELIAQKFPHIALRAVMTV